MAVISVNDYLASARQNISWMRTGARTTVAAMPFSVFDVAGNPGAGTLAAANTANGVVPTDATAGYPLINAFAGGAKGYVSRVRFASSVPCRITLWDRVFLAGAYSFNSNVSLASQPSFSGRIPSVEGYSATELWLEFVTAGSGAQTITVGYTRGDGTTGRSTGAIATGITGTVGRCVPLSLAAGDSGIQTIESVLGANASAGTFNLMILRKLHEMRVKSANDGDTHDLTKTGMPEIYADSALYATVACDSTALGVPDMTIEIASR